ncbi:MAG: type II secretion system protein GspG [Deltaproteobacteria bacterium]|uniref:type II secretion system protein GspG n=1 Tax=Candidatus Deferrimicrobium sp. TaxID=3060586 RepID=UPI002718CD2A|nr:type II secretion system protein GspG [Candidatus Deferrimicrobium sp.]MCR4309303.1 type II secretion system protein GspG [Deltaproteobacteria bacterium]MDO8739696.1 type II secretion system protein GspG [Candidatus Deferrimicrobium sp.]
MRKRNEKGFTLIEVVVVVAVIAILAAVLTPYITKYIDDSKIAKARNEAQVIGAAMTNFYKDVGEWPNHNPTTTTGAAVAAVVLYTGTVTPATAAIFTTPPAVVPVVQPWTGTVYTLDNSLLVNGASGNAYPQRADMQWKGPYAGSALPADPWGKPYVVNITATGGPIWVLSAGPNGKVQTRVIDNVVLGDDIGFRVR